MEGEGVWYDILNLIAIIIQFLFGFVLFFGVGIIAVYEPKPWISLSIILGIFAWMFLFFFLHFHGYGLGALGVEEKAKEA